MEERNEGLVVVIFSYLRATLVWMVYRSWMVVYVEWSSKLDVGARWMVVVRKETGAEMLRADK